MKLSIDTFRGEAPRISARNLPANGAQEATNCRLQTGDLEAWRQFLLTKALANTGPVQTIYLLNGAWLSWNEQVDVARGVIAGDNTFRTYLTAPGLYGQPRFTTYAMATTGAEPFPVATRPLGVPAPEDRPTLTINPAAVVTGNLAVTNGDAEAGSVGWTSTTGALTTMTGASVPGLAAHAGSQYWSGGPHALTEAEQSIDMAATGLLEGQGVTLQWYQAGGGGGSGGAMGIRFYDVADALLGEVMADSLATTPALTWEQRTLTATVPAGATSLRLVQQFTRVGPDNDAYIDTITLDSIDYTNSFDGSSLTGWTVSPTIGGTASDKHRIVKIDEAVGWPAPSFSMRCDEKVAYIYRDFATEESSSVVLTFDYMEDRTRTNSGLHVLLYGSGAGSGTSVFFSSWGGVRLYSHPDWDTIGASVETLAPALAIDTRYTVTMTASKKRTFEASLVIRVVNAGTGEVVVDDETVVLPIDGSNVGFKGGPGSMHNIWNIDNVSVLVSPPSPDAAETLVATSYVYTWVNDIGEESAPSPASEVIQRSLNSSVVVTTADEVPPEWADYVITHKRLYRAVSGSTGVAFLLVVELPVATAAYTDAFDDSDIADNDVLESDEWDLPPDDLEGIIALPNGIMCGFRRNQLCMSVAGRPHAWPVRFRRPTDTDIVAIANIDNTVVIGTQSFLYTATGNAPDSYSMSQPGDPQACVSKRSMTFLQDVGVVYASPDGWMVCNGSAGQVRNASGAIFTRRQWQALNPASIIATVHDGVLFWFSTGQTPDGGYALDTKPDGFGLIRLAFHATAVHVDPLTDALYLVLDQNDEPTDPALPLASTAVVPDGLTVYQFDAGASDMVYRWRGRLNLTPYPLALLIAQVRALTFTNLLVRVYGDGTLIYQRLLASGREFTLPALNAYDSYELELIGTSTTRTVQAAEEVTELT